MEDKMSSHEKMLEIHKIVEKWKYGLAGVSASDAVHQIRSILNGDNGNMIAWLRRLWYANISLQIEKDRSYVLDEIDKYSSGEIFDRAEYDRRSERVQRVDGKLKPDEEYHSIFDDIDDLLEDMGDGKSRLKDSVRRHDR